MLMDMFFDCCEVCLNLNLFLKHFTQFYAILRFHSPDVFLDRTEEASSF